MDDLVTLEWMLHSFGGTIEAVPPQDDFSARGSWYKWTSRKGKEYVYPSLAKLAESAVFDALRQASL